MCIRDSFNAIAAPKRLAEPVINTSFLDLELVELLSPDILMPDALHV